MQVKKESWIKVHYTGSFEDGSVFDSSKDRDPLEFQAGMGMVVKGFDDAVMGMSIGDEKTVKIPAKDAYGDINKEVREIPKEMMTDVNLEKGVSQEIMTNMGPFVIELVSEDKNMLNVILNHPLAGKNLTFKIKLEKILSDKEVKEKLAKMSCESCAGDCNSCN